MEQDTALQNRMQRMGDLIGQIEATADPNTRALARDLLKSLMAIHGAALERILEIAAEAGEAGQAMIRKCGRDEVVGNLLLLYGLNPEDLHSRVTAALEKSRCYLESHAAKVDLVSAGDDGTITLRLHITTRGCGSASASASVKSTLEAALLNAVPDATSIVVEETRAAEPTLGFVPIGQLLGVQATTAAAGRAPGPERLRCPR
jgi:Fe-S cluster biogenesis protein NfuA